MFYISFVQVPKANCLNGSASSWHVEFSICIKSDLRETIPLSPVKFSVTVVNDDPYDKSWTIYKDILVATWAPRSVGDIYRVSRGMVDFVLRSLLTCLTL